MNQYTPDKLRLVLNFDSHQEKNFSMVERSQIHQAISKVMNGYEHELPKVLCRKIIETLGHIRMTGYKSKEVVYCLDVDEHIRIKSNQ